jgi:Aspartyl protease/Tetratricopeptide repeat
MKGLAFAPVFALFLMAAYPAAVIGQTTDLQTADGLFKAGKFAESGKAFAAVAARNPAYAESQLQLGRIALLANRLDEAQGRLEKALALQPNNHEAKILLAEVFYRRDNFGEAARMMAGLGPGDSAMLANVSTLNRAKLESFHGLTPYEVAGAGQTTKIKLLKSDPLPLVKVRLNGGKEVVFFIDTGGAELGLDTEFAKELGIPQFGAVQGTFSGGQHAPVQNGRINSITVGGWMVKNVPVQILALRQLSQAFGVAQLDGYIGTVFLYHFLSTIDFRNGELVLQRKTTGFRTKGVEVPFWMAGDHFIVGWGKINTLPPALLFVDTGVAGAGAKLAPSVLQRAGIQLIKKDASAGQGGGGSFTTVPYVVQELSFGDIRESKVSGVFDGPYPWEHSLGFFIAGSVGHDFFTPYSVTFDFSRMVMTLDRGQ